MVEKTETIDTTASTSKSQGWEWLEKAVSGVKTVADVVVDLSASGVDVAKNYKVAKDAIEGKTVSVNSSAISVNPLIVAGAIGLATLFL